MNLHHYTCLNAATKIYRSGVILPAPQPALDMLPLIWLAAMPRRGLNVSDHLGLSPHCNRPSCLDEPTPCDPTAIRFSISVDPGDHKYVRPFSLLAEDFPDACAVYRALPRAKTWRWWVALRPIRIRVSSQLQEQSS